MICSRLERTRLVTTRRADVAGVISLASVLSIVLGSASVMEPRLFWPAAFMVLALGLVVAAITWPRASLVLTLVALAYIPVYSLPPIRHFPLHPASALAWVLAAGFLLQTRTPADSGARCMSLVDFTVVAFVVTSGMSVLFHVRSLSDFSGRFAGWLGPYLALRLLGQKPSDRRFVARTFALVAASLLPFVFCEWAWQVNPFRHFHANPVLWSLWGTTTERLGRTRVQASFAHPIALAMFLSTAAIFAAALATSARTSRCRLAWLGLAAAFAFAQALTLSRTGWVVLVAGAALVLLKRPRAIAHPRVVGTLAAAILAIAIFPQLSPVRSVLASPFTGPTTSEIAQSDRYRGMLYTSALQPGQLHTFGSRVSTLKGALDSEYIRTAELWGFVPAVLLLAIAGAVLMKLVRSRDMLDVFLLSACLANFIGLLLVAFIAQQQIYIWLLLGVAAAAGSTRSSGAFQSTRNA